MDDKFIVPGEENNYNKEELKKTTPAESYIDTENIVEEIRELNNVKYYFALFGNSPEETIQAINTFKQRILLITGGNDENISYDLLGEILVEKVKHLILFGPTSPLIEVCLMRKLVGKNQGIDIRITHCGTLKQAVDCAYLSSKPNDLVLLSPASNCVSELKEIYIKYVDSL